MAHPTTRRTTALLTLLLCSGAMPVAAAPPETAPESLVGWRVRITAREDQPLWERLDGRVTAVEGPNLVIEPTSGEPSRTLQPWRSIHRLDIHRGRRRATREGFWTGAILVGAVGGALGFFAGILSTDGQDRNALGPAATGFTVGAAVCGLAGGALGAGIGSTIEKDDWGRTEIPRTKTGFSLQPARGGVKVALSVRF